MIGYDGCQKTKLANIKLNIMFVNRKGTLFGPFMEPKNRPYYNVPYLGFDP